MSNEEHYFENLIYSGKDCEGEPNKSALSKEVQEAIEICYCYLKNNAFHIIDKLCKDLESQEEKLYELKECSKCKFWRLDSNDKNRRCKYCYDQDEWQAESEVEE